MNKLHKYILIGIGITSITIATIINYSEGIDITRSQSYGWTNNKVDSTPLNENETFCFSVPCDNAYYDIGNGYSKILQNVLYCIYYDDVGSDKRLNLKNECGSTQVFNYLRTTDPLQGSYIYKNSCPTMSSSECQQEYSLIPINAVDQNYCESNNLCTVCNDTPGEINTGVSWSSLFLNGTQINSNAIIDIYADDRLNTEVDYLNDTVDINITQNIDTSYIEDIKNKEKLTPTNEDVEYMIQGLQVYIPYIFIGLIIVYTLYLIKKFFRG